ncbi:hypothetical protein IV102_14340 [bacterium]|nr:hypothetical protein [bacterium]
MRKCLVVLIFASFWLAARSQGPDEQALQDARSCQSNLKTLAMACELYGTDWACYPPRLRHLTLKGLSGGYLKSIPTCPAAGADTYSATYHQRMSKFDKKGRYVAGVDHFRLCCGGHHHQAANYGPDRPAYDAKRGLMVR